MNTQASKGFSDVKGVVAVDQHVPTAGAIVWWRLSGTVDFEVIKKAWEKAGLDEKDLLTPCSPTTALRRAVDELREKRTLVRPLGRSNGFAIVKEMLTDAHDSAERLGATPTVNRELEYDVLCKVMLDDVGRVKVETVGASDDLVNKIAKEVRENFERNLSTLETQDFSCWLVRMMPRLDAVGLREGGGVYFVPHDRVEHVAKVVGVLREVSSHIVNRVPAMRSDDAVEAILDAITQEAEGEAAALERALTENKLGERGFENRLSHCDLVESKVARYEGLLGKNLDVLREKLEDLRARLTLAVLKQQSADEKAAE